MDKIEGEIKKIWRSLGPGLITGAADDDPSGIATYSQAGAGFGFKFIWLAVWTFPLAAIVHEMCARITLVTGRGLAENIKIHFSKKWLYSIGLLVVFANTLNIGADLGGMADAIKIFFPQISPWVPMALIALSTVYLEVFISYRMYSKYLKWLAFSILSYVITALFINFDLTDLVYDALVPSLSFDKESVLIIAAILGTTISPYLFFWVSGEEEEDEIKSGNSTIKKREIDGPKEIKRMRFDVWFGMFFSNVVTFAIIAVCAATLYPNGIMNITNAAQAALALKPLAGQFAYLLFTFGIVSAGLLAVPVLAGSSAYIMSEMFGWKKGLYRKPKDAIAFYLVITLSLLFGLMFNFFGVNPIKALIYTSVANGIVTPIVLVFIVVLASRSNVMGRYKNGLLVKIIGWGTVAVMGAISIAVLVPFF